MTDSEAITPAVCGSTSRLNGVDHLFNCIELDAPLALYAVCLAVTNRGRQSRVQIMTAQAQSDVTRTLGDRFLHVSRLLSTLGLPLTSSFLLDNSSEYLNEYSSTRLYRKYLNTSCQ